MTSDQFLEATRQARFHSLMDQFRALHESGKGDTDQALDLLAEALTLAPPEIKQQMDAKIEEIWGKMPKAEYCDDSGNHCYTIPQLEKWLGRKIGPDDLARISKRHQAPDKAHRLH